MNRAILAWIATVAGLAGAPCPAAEPCVPDAGLSYVCGLQRPEDIVRIPGTPWLIVSGFAPGAGLRFIDSRDRSMRPAYQRRPGELAPDPELPSQCSGPVDPALFNTRGLSLRAVGPDRWQLLVVNHGGRESIEIFEVELETRTPRLRWRGCVPLPQGQVGNSVAAFADGTVLATVLTRPGTTIADFVEGRTTGAVWRWNRGMTGFEAVPGTELPGNNGIEVDPDGQHYYVVAFGWHAVAIFDRARNDGPVAVVSAPDFMPDNIHWSDGRLLLAGMRYDEPACGGRRKVVAGVADPMLCHRGWIVGELDMRERRVATVAYGGPQPQFNGISAAALVSGELWIGSFQSDRLAVVRIP